MDKEKIATISENLQRKALFPWEQLPRYGYVKQAQTRFNHTVMEFHKYFVEQKRSNQEIIRPIYEVLKLLNDINTRQEGFTNEGIAKVSSSNFSTSMKKLEANKKGSIHSIINDDKTKNDTAIYSKENKDNLRKYYEINEGNIPTKKQRELIIENLMAISKSTESMAKIRPIEKAQNYLNDIARNTKWIKTPSGKIEKGLQDIVSQELAKAIKEFVTWQKDIPKIN